MRCMQVSRDSTLQQWKAALHCSVLHSPTNCTRRCKTLSGLQPMRSVTTMRCPRCQMCKTSPTRAMTATVRRKCSIQLWDRPPATLTLHVPHQIRSQHQLNPSPRHHDPGHTSPPTRTSPDQKHKCYPHTSPRTVAATQIPRPLDPPRT